MTHNNQSGRVMTMPFVVRVIGGLLLLGAVVILVANILMRYDTALDARRSISSDSTSTATSTIETTASVTATDAVIPEGGAYVMVIADGLKLRDQPSTDSAILKSLSLGQKLLWIETGDGWYKVEDGVGAQGWVAAGSEYSELVQP